MLSSYALPPRMPDFTGALGLRDNLPKALLRDTVIP